MKNLLQGFSYNVKGISYFLNNRWLWKYLIIPYIINVLAIFCLFSLLTYYFNDLFLLVSKPLLSFDIQNPENFLYHLLDGGLWVIRFLLKIIFFIFSLFALFLGVFFLSTIINSPFYEMMTEKILIHEGALQEIPFSFKRIFQTGLYTIFFQTKYFLFFSPITIALMLLTFLPGIGFIFIIVQAVFSAWVFGFNLCVLPFIFKESKWKILMSWAGKNAIKLIGFGSLNLIPFVGFFILGIQVPGAALLYLDTKPEHQSLGN